MQKLYICFDTQLKMLIQQNFEKFNKEVRSLSKKDEVNEEFAQQSGELYHRIITEFKKQSESLIMENSNWGDQVHMHYSEIEQQLKTLIHHAREKEIDKLQVLTQKAYKDRVEEIVNGPIYELDSNFWEEIKKPYIEELMQIKISCESVLDSSFKADKYEISEFLQTLETSIYDFTVEYLRKLFFDINPNLIRKFNKLFKKDEQDKNRDWRAIEENQIRELWKKCKAETDELFNEFKYVKIPRGSQALNIHATTDGGPPSLNRSLSVMFPRLLTEANLNALKDKYNEHVEHILEEAIRKHVSLSTLLIISVAQYSSHYHPMVDVCITCILRLRQHIVMARLTFPVLSSNVDRRRISNALLDGHGSFDRANRQTDY